MEGEHLKISHTWQELTVTIILIKLRRINKNNNLNEVR
jgi:hypothetical protein